MSSTARTRERLGGAGISAQGFEEENWRNFCMEPARRFASQTSRRGTLSLAACNEASKLNKGSGRSCVLKISLHLFYSRSWKHVLFKTDLFVEFPEISPQIKQKQEQDEATLKGTSSEQCKDTESKHKVLNDNQKTNAALKDSTYSWLECKGPCLRMLASVEFDASVNLDDQRRHLQQPGSNLQLKGNVAVKDNGGGNSSSSICFPFRYNSCMIDVDTEKDRTLVKERLDSYNLQCGNLPESSLWTDKYQPENTSELCGNIKSIRILNEWLKSWDEGPRSNSESYMDDVDDEAIHKNVLLLTGPIGFV